MKKMENAPTSKAKIGVMGTGYVGIVTGACFAKMGHKVICSDIDSQKVVKMKQGFCPIHEDGLPDLLEEALAKGNLDFTDDNKELVDKTDFIFICVGTPENEDGSADLKYIYGCCEDIARHMNEPKTIVIKSTVPVAAIEAIRQRIASNTNVKFHLATNPEFLAQGTAVHDFMHPDRVVIGADTIKAANTMAALYENVDAPVIRADVASAMMIKYASNAFLATKISFINAMANLCEKTGADIEKVAEGMGHDKRIGKLFLRAGVGYGGSCFPKDTKALFHQAKEVGYDFDLMKAVIDINKNQRKVFIDKLKERLGKIKGKRIAVLGLAFKPMTDDLREAPALYIIDELLKEGCSVCAFDPIVKKLAGFEGVGIHNDPYKAVEKADAVLVVTDYKELKELDFSKIASLVNNRVIIDGRNILSGKDLRDIGFLYSSIGRGDA